jgi:hypothetical protein
MDGILLDGHASAVQLSLLPVAAILGAIGRRVAGGITPQIFNGWKLPGFIAKVTFGALLGLAAFLGGAPPLLCGFVGIGCFLGHIFGLHESASMGHYGPDNMAFSERLFWQHCLGMAAYGLAVMSGPVLWSICPVHDHWTAAGPIAAGLLTPAAYALGWAIKDHRPGTPGLDGNPLELSEWMAGALYGIASFWAGHQG